MQTSLTFLVLLHAALPSLCSITPPSDLGRPGERDAGNLTIDQAIRGTMDPDMPSMIMAADGLVLAELDMMLTQDQYDSLYGNGEGRKKRSATFDEKLRWTNATLKYRFREKHFSTYEQYMTRRAMTDWERYTCINMEPAEKGVKNFVMIQNGYGCNSQLGMIGGQQPLNLEYPGCRYKGLYLHELGHAIGLVHEHQLPNRDDYIEVIMDNVQDDLKIWFNKYNSKEVNQMGVPYEYSSIMHYGITAFSKDGTSQTIKAKFPEREADIGKVYLKELAYVDAEIVNKMYKCAAHCPDKTKCGSEGHLDQNCNCICQDGSQDCDKTKTPVDKSCTNNYKSWACYMWANQGECTRNPRFMQSQCAKACNQCGPKPVMPSPCKNQYVNSKCDKWAKRGDCLTNTHWMTYNCPVSCNLCTHEGNKEKENCKDSAEVAKCIGWSLTGECIINPIGMFLNCQRSCMECDKTEEQMEERGFDIYGDIEYEEVDTGECVDKNIQCIDWQARGECENNPNWMIKNCRKACGKCDDGECKNLDVDIMCTNWAKSGECTANSVWMSKYCALACGTGACVGRSTPVPQPITTTEPAICKNDHETCETWAKGGQCLVNPGYMKVHCRKACHICGADSSSDVVTPRPSFSPDCQDSRLECASWANAGFCEDYDTSTLKTCRRSCNNCGCEDKHQMCTEWANQRSCETNPGYMLRNCQKACKIC